MDNSTMRDMILRGLKKEEGFENMVTAELNGNYYSAADIALPDSDGSHQVYRIAVVKHNQQKSFT